MEGVFLCLGIFPEPQDLIVEKLIHIHAGFLSCLKGRGKGNGELPEAVLRGIGLGEEVFPGAVGGVFVFVVITVVSDNVVGRPEVRSDVPDKYDSFGLAVGQLHDGELQGDYQPLDKV